jgi:GT2 family glycosyltransferase
VSIVIPVHNGCELLRRLLVSISRQSVEPLEVIVVDNGSTDNAPEVAARMGARLIAMGRNAGFAAAVNRGIQESKGEGIALVNSDVELHSNWLETLWSGAGVSGFATGKILQAGSQEILDGAYDLICRGGCAWRAGAGRTEASLREPEGIRFCPATAAIYRASVFRTVGLFEEAFDSYLEDVDFGLRCAAARIAGCYIPAAVCWHRGSATFGRWSPRVVRLIARNQIFLIARHYPWALIFRWLWPILVAQSLWGALALRHGCGIACLRGKIEGLVRFAGIRRAGREKKSNSAVESGVPAGSGRFFLTSAPIADLSPIIAESERQIHQLQCRTGFDAYWKVYFRLVGLAK